MCGVILHTEPNKNKINISKETKNNRPNNINNTINPNNVLI